MSEKKWVYLFRELSSFNPQLVKDQENLQRLMGKLGEQQHGLTCVGIPFIPGFFVTTEATAEILYGDEAAWRDTWEQARTALNVVEAEIGRKLGSSSNPLLLTCRSSSGVSTFSKMEPVIGIGLNDRSVKGLAAQVGSEPYAYDMYLRFIWKLGLAIFDIPNDAFYALLEQERIQQECGGLALDEWEDLIVRAKKIFHDHTGEDFPQAPLEQLRLAFRAGFGASQSKRAHFLQRIPGFPIESGDEHIALCFKAMVFGNSGSKSAIGEVFSRCPTSGQNCLSGEYLLNAERPEFRAGKSETRSIELLQQDIPQAYEQLLIICDRLEHEQHCIQKVEFCIENGRIWVLKIKPAPTNLRAALKIAMDMAHQGLISKEEAIQCIAPDRLDEILYPQFDFDILQKNEEESPLLAMGKGASPGVTIGRVYFDADTAEHMANEEKQNVIFARPYFLPEDVHGMLAANGLISEEGGVSSNAAMMARQFIKPYVTDFSAIEMDLQYQEMILNGHIIREGDWVSIDGSTGAVFMGAMKMSQATIEDESNLFKLLSWADQVCSQPEIRMGADGEPTSGLKVWVNADYPNDAWRGRSNCARGLGLCHSENMLFEMDLLPIMQRMILSNSEEERRGNLDLLLPSQINHYEEMFEAMDGQPIVIQLLNTPLIDFLPDAQELLEDIITMRVKGESEGLTEKELLLVRINALKESNPLLGVRGARLAVMMPEIVESQVQAIFEAAANVMLKKVKPFPRILIPMAGHSSELKYILPKLKYIAQSVMDERDVEIPCEFGVLVEIPRGAVVAAKLAREVSFFSFDLTELTQHALGLSKVDAERKFLPKYLDQRIFDKDPFKSLDLEGVGEMMKAAVCAARFANPGLEIGAFGDQVLDQATVDFLHDIGVTYISVPVLELSRARLLVAHAAVRPAAQKR